MISVLINNLLKVFLIPNPQLAKKEVLLNTGRRWGLPFPLLLDDVMRSHFSDNKTSNFGAIEKYKSNDELETN